MRLLVVVGSGSGCGKTTLVCRILRAVPGLGAVKVSPREGPARVERGAGLPGKDTDLFAASGGAPVARIVGPREQAPEAWAGIAGEFAACRAVVVEGTGGLLIPAEQRLVVFVAGQNWRLERPERNARLASAADLILEGALGDSTDDVPEIIRRFLSQDTWRERH